MTRPHELRGLHEEVFLIALQESGRREGLAGWARTALGAAVLAELSLAGRVRAVQDGKQRRVETLSTEPLGEPVLDDALRRIATDEKRRLLGEWLTKISGRPELWEEVGAGLCERGVLAREERKRLFFFKAVDFPERDGAPEQALRERLREAVLGDGEVEPRTTCALSILKATGMLGIVLDSTELKARGERLGALLDGKCCSKEVEELIASTNTMIFAMLILPVVMPNITTPGT